MNETELLPCEDELRTLRPASMEKLEDWIIESVRLEDLYSTRQKAVDAVNVLFGAEFDEDRKLIARILLEDVLKNAPHHPEPSAVQPREKETSLLPSKFYNTFPFVGFLVLAIAVIYANWQKTPDWTPFDTPEKPTTPAVVIDMADVQWTGESPKLGEPLQPGQLAFESGTVELLFFNGVRSVIEGPAELTLLNEGRVFCGQGKWSVTVPPSGIGFEIQTPHSTIRDLGTQFYAAVDEKNCDVHVLKGKVELKDGGGKKTVFKANQAVSTRAGEILDRMGSVAEFFVPKNEMRRRSGDYWQRNPVPSPRGGGMGPTFSVDFSQENPEGVTLFSVKRVPGRSPEQTVPRFVERNSRIRLKSLGKLSAFTVLVDIKINRLSGESNPILMSEGTKQGGLVWNITPKGAMIFGLRGRTSQGNKMFVSPIVVTKESLKQWMQLGLSVNERGRMSVYINGDMVCSAKLPNVEAVDLSELDLGNWKLKENIGQLDGTVESVTVFDSALEWHEIRNQQKPEWSAAQ